MFHILVAEDDPDLNELFCTVLEENGFQSFSAADGEQALELMDREYIDLVISDIMMPRMDGYELTKAIRQINPLLPVLMITAKDGAFYKREGFQAGIDDYMVKPVDVNEMIWRVRALLRRSQVTHERILTVGTTVLKFDSYSVTVNGREEILPPKEFSLLFKLLSTPGRTFTRIQLLDEIWGVDTEVDAHTLEVHIGRLRERFRGNSDFELVTVRGLGYKAVLQ
ncbi:response regulator transcription factor [Holdemania massiliensis]|uniref:response regulator transcription factor n=1 Tax=Holdemania massiliensis TaxID=1468449 RepID=UPI001F05B771|nr:response regulator transcription factor [Holdemania massiliensis]MCH1941293.1 response regulator transcription factor [Holdemania massiliensis]